jgi:hypothetical protein
MSADKPFAVTIRAASVLLGNKCRTSMYAAAGRGQLDFVKDGSKTLVTIESIERYQRSWKRAAIKQTATV